MNTVEIGSKWTPDHAVFRDDRAGVFYEVNSPIESRTEVEVQRALLDGKPLAVALAIERWELVVRIVDQPDTPESYQAAAIAEAQARHILGND